MTANCEGKCGRTVEDEGKWCFVCWANWCTNESPSPMSKSDPNTIPPASDFGLRMEIHNASFRLCFGTKAERPEVIAKLAHLINVLQTETHLNQNKET